MLDDLSLFVSIVEAGSLSAAADKEKLPTATVTRRLQQLENKIGHRLLNRSARRLQLTTEGAQYYEQCRPLVQALHQATQRLEGIFSEVAGHIRVLAPTNLASGPLAPAWVTFMRNYPDVTLELELSNSVQDLAASAADIAIRVGALKDSMLMQRRLGTSALVLVAAPGYVRESGDVNDVQSLERRALIVADPLRNWTFRDPQDGSEIIFKPKPRFRANDMRLAVAMAEAGIGILRCPHVYCRRQLEAGTLVPLLSDWAPEDAGLFAVWSQQRYLPARVRALLEHLARHFELHPL